MVGGGDIRKILLSIQMLQCCPFCGAPLRITDGRCDACGSPIDRNLLVSFVKLKLASDQLGGIDDNRIINDMAEVSYRISLASEYVRSKIMLSIKEKIRSLREDRDKLHEVFTEISRQEDEIINTLRGVLEKQQEALRARSLDALERAYEDLWKALEKYGKMLTPEVIGLYTLPDFAAEVANRYYKANRFDSAIQWYGLTILATMYPESAPKGLPKRMSAVQIPFGVVHIGIFDGDFDGKPEVFYVPSRDIEGLKAPCVVINEGGVSWNPLDRYSIVFPIFGDYGDRLVVIFAWESPRSADAKLISEGKEIRIIRDSETHYSIPAYLLSHADIDGDGHLELIVSSGRGRILFLDGKEKHFEAKVLLTGDVVSLAPLRTADGVKIVAMTMDGRLLLIDPQNYDITLVESGFRDPSSILVSTGDLDEDGNDELYVATVDGGYRYVLKDGDFVGSKVIEDEVVGMQVVDIDGDGKKELIAFRLGGAPSLDIYELKRALGVELLEKIASYPVPLSKRVGRANVDYSNPFGSRPAFICGDVDSDGAPEIFVGLMGSLLVIDPKYV